MLKSRKTNFATLAMNTHNEHSMNFLSNSVFDSIYFQNENLGKWEAKIWSGALQSPLSSARQTFIQAFCNETLT